jgi:hypothetical protein
MFALRNANTFVSLTSYYKLLKMSNMKTFRFATIAAIIALAMVSLSYADGFTENPITKKAMNISFEKAMHDPGLVAAMSRQVDLEDVMNSPTHIYIARVVYHSTEYFVHGTIEQWKSFLKYPATTQIKTPRGMNTN